ncbi:enoyl-CoA hydratase-related protein [Profundibacterium mesophilum]|uniref:Enoyl-CoA hydratase n=1 Tax=Profundibacterium mesophilum KAUST100406-0324 TaxID=1037889 RepID=A0A921NS40_9RHOB|nr:enoyl-CoA hydratase-related protein [Profundibacterium mesophilum]KAF0676880.1 enoyl-CoA hydratase [Profundibacterium mesophilum KAUST100406-0324]
MSFVRVEDEGDRLLVVNTNAARRGALTAEYHAALCAALERAAADPRIASVILCAEGGFFCAGGDLNILATRAELTETERSAHIEVLHRSVRAIRACPRPVIAAVEGGAAGAGVSIAFACDLLVAAEDARFTLAYVKAGLVPDGGVLAVLARSLPPMLLSRMALTGAPVGAQRLDALGALSLMTPAGGALAGARELAAEIAAGPGKAQTAIKALLEQGRTEGVEAQLTAEARAMAHAQGQAEAAEGIAAFLGRRPADFAKLRGEP